MHPKTSRSFPTYIHCNIIIEAIISRTPLPIGEKVYPASGRRSSKSGAPYRKQSRGRLCDWVLMSPHPRTLQGVTVSESALPVLRLLFRGSMFDVSRVFWF